MNDMRYDAASPPRRKKQSSRRRQQQQQRNAPQSSRSGARERVQRAPAKQTVLTVPEVAIEIGVSEATAWRIVWSGSIVSFHIGRLRKVARADVDAYIARQRALSAVA